MNNNIESEEENSSSDNDTDEDVRDDVASTSRKKRDIEWCGVDTEQHSASQYHRSPSPNITWPPDPATLGSYNWRNLRPVKPGNPLYGTKMQLFSKTNYNLAVYADGSVRGTMDDGDLHTHLELMTAGHAGHVRIRGSLTNLYVAMDKKGRLYGEVLDISKPDMMEDGTVFIEAFQGSYNTYLSRQYAHLGWYLGIKKSGQFKKGPKTSYRQKAVHFLPRRSKFE